MTSQLTARLLKGYPQRVTNDGGPQPQQQYRAPGMKASPKMPSALSGSITVGGYSADRESNSSSVMPPVSIDLQTRHKRSSAALTPQERSKRLKVQEENFAAATAKSDLARAGLQIPSLKIDPKNDLVGHMYSSAVASSPFLCPQYAEASSLATSALDTLWLIDIASRCKEFYQGLLKVESAELGEKGCTTEEEGSTSSFTDTESTASDEDRESGHAKKTKTYASMGDALSISREARIITLSLPPYTIVHVNAAFTKITGLSSVKTLGRPFSDLVRDENLLEVLSECADTLLGKIVPGQGLKAKTFARRQDYLPCNISVSPVGSSSQSATHLAMEMHVVKDAEESPEQAPSLIDHVTSAPVYQIG